MAATWWTRTYAFGKVPGDSERVKRVLALNWRQVLMSVNLMVLIVLTQDS